jgi:phage terminase large subunit
VAVNVTGAMSEAAVEQQRIEYTSIFGQEAADAIIDQEYYCNFEAAVLGAYWGKEMLLAEQQGRICDVPANPDLPVHTAWDIGVDDAMAIWCFQVYPDHLDIVDYYEGHGQGFDHYCAWLDERGLSIGAAIPAPTGCRTTPSFARLERLERARGSRRSSHSAASLSWPPSSQ